MPDAITTDPYAGDVPGLLFTMEPDAISEAELLNEQAPRTPHMHRFHVTETPCGCWTGNWSSMSCRWCGASYELDEVLSFASFRCYDCRASISTSLLHAERLGSAKQ